MKQILQKFKRCLILFFIIWVPLNCTTIRKTEMGGSKGKPSKTEVTEASFITSIKSEILEDRSRVYLKATKKMQYTAFKLTDPLRLILDIPDMMLKPEAQKSIPLNNGAVNSISTQYFNESNITRVIIGLTQNVHYDITRTNENELRIDIDLPMEKQAKTELQQETSISLAGEQKEAPMEIAAFVEEPEMPSPDTAKQKDEEPEIVNEEPKSIKGKKKFTGQRISLDFQDANLKNVLRLIAEISGFNIVTSPDVKGTVNLRLIDVPWDQVLDFILKNNDLGMQKEGNIIRIASRAKLDKEKQAEISNASQELALKATMEQSEELIFTTIPISYAELADIKSVLETMKSKRGEIKTDNRTNTLILYDIKAKIEEMKDLIKVLDKRTQQVTIQARIVEVNTNFTQEFGIQWGGSLAKTTSKIFPNTIQLTGGPVGSTSNFIVDLPAPVGPGTGAGLGIALGSLTGAALLDIQLSAMEDSGNGRILSSPKITTTNHTEASISSGRKIPYETISSEGTKTELVDATIDLTVTPHITPDGYISLEIHATKDQADFSQTSAGGAPTILTKDIKTEVLVKNGETTVLGGLYTSNIARTDSGVPFFSKIPVLGWLFKKRKNLNESEELLIFITPLLVEF